MSQLTRLKHPIVLIHGLGAPPRLGPFDYFYKLPEILRKAGNTVYIANLTAFGRIENRAVELKRQLDEKLPEGKLNLLGHSMGGLDARYVTSVLGLAPRVASVTSIGTPHRGSIMGDIATDLVGEDVFHAIERALVPLKHSPVPFAQISSQYCAETFNPMVPDAPGVAYFSATSAISDPVRESALPVFWVPHRIMKRHEGDNDGFVSVHSATWGEHICTYPGDHYAQIGQWLGNTRGLDYLGFYSEILARLKREGF